jgi:hypothetical protein
MAHKRMRENGFRLIFFSSVVFAPCQKNLIKSLIFWDLVGRRCCNFGRWDDCRKKKERTRQTRSLFAKWATPFPIRRVKSRRRRSFSLSLSAAQAVKLLLYKNDVNCSTECEQYAITRIEIKCSGNGVINRSGKIRARRRELRDEQRAHDDVFAFSSSRVWCWN